MITRWPPRLVHWLTFAVVTTACGTTNPTDVDLSGDWVATIDADGIGAVRLSLVERSKEVSGSGQWTPLAGTEPLAVAAVGLHFDDTINLTLTFTTATQPTTYNTQGRVESTNSFYLVFPAGNNPVRVQFQRR